MTNYKNLTGEEIEKIIINHCLTENFNIYADFYIAMPEFLLYRLLTSKKEFGYDDGYYDGCYHFNGIKFVTFKQMEKRGVINFNQEHLQKENVVAIFLNDIVKIKGNIYVKDKEIIRIE